MKTLLLFAVFVGLGIQPASALAIESPQPVTPGDRETVSVDPTNGVGVTLTISNPAGPGQGVSGEASLSPATYPAGGFEDPLAAHFTGLPTHDPHVDTASLSAYDFSAGGSLYGGPTARVYWHPYGFGCIDEGSGPVCGNRYGATRSFIYTTLGTAVPTNPPGGTPESRCMIARRVTKKARVLVNVAGRRFRAASGGPEAKHWRSRFKHDKALLRYAKKKEKEACTTG